MQQRDEALAQIGEADASIQQLSEQLAAIDVTLARGRDNLLAARQAIEAVPSIVGFPPFEPVKVDADTAAGVADQISAELNRDGLNYRYIGPGRYPIDALRSIRPRSGLVVAIHPETVFDVKPHDQRLSNAIFMEELSDVVWIGGIVIGDRRLHTYTPLSGTLGTHEWNHGMRIKQGRNILVKDLTVRECAGDGVSVGGDDITLDGVAASANRRNGLTMGGGRRIRFLRCLAEKTGKMPLADGSIQPGAANGPWAGIDIEPDARGVEEGLIEGCIISFNQSSGIAALVRSGLKFDLDFVARNNTFRDNSNGLYAESQDGLRTITLVATGNVFDRVRNQAFRLEGGAVATIGGASGSKERNVFIGRTARTERELSGDPTLSGYTNDIGALAGSRVNALYNLYRS